MKEVAEEKETEVGIYEGTKTCYANIFLYEKERRNHQIFSKADLMLMDTYFLISGTTFDSIARGFEVYGKTGVGLTTYITELIKEKSTRPWLLSSVRHDFLTRKLGNC